MASADILRAARARIEDPKNWTTHTTARNDLGEPCNAMADEAVCWCGYGALVAESRCINCYQLLSKAASDLFNGASIGSVNDKRGHEAMLAVFDAAIAAAEAEAGR